MSVDDHLVRALRRGLRERADPGKAPQMQAYMKSAMPYRGVQTPEQRRLFKHVFAAHELASFEDWRDTVIALWSGARYREERYAAIELAAQRPYWRFHTMRALPVYERMIVEGAWWDYVDAIATHALTLLLGRHRASMSRRMRTWARGRDVWKRRSAILCQNPMKGETDRELLYACIEPSLGRDEFFLRKAIGWALRQYAYADPDEVIRYVRANRERLSPLSKREALKTCLKDGRIDAVP